MIHLMPKQTTASWKDKVENFLNSWSESILFDLNDDLYGNSDEPDVVSEWDDIKNDLDKNDLIEMVVEFMDDHNMSYDDLKKISKDYK